MAHGVHMLADVALATQPLGYMRPDQLVYSQSLDSSLPSGYPTPPDGSPQCHHCSKSSSSSLVPSWNTLVHPTTILKNMMAKANRTRPLFNYPTMVQRRFLPEQRSRLISWISTLIRAFRYHPETLVYAVNYLDRYLSTVVVNRNHMAIATVSFYLAAKFNEEEREPRAIDVADCSTALGQPLIPSELFKLELKVLKALHHDMLIVTPHAVLAQVVKSVDWIKETLYGRDKIVWDCAHAFLDTIQFHLYVLTFDPIVLGLAALCCSMDASTVDPFARPAPQRTLHLTVPWWWNDAICLLNQPNGLVELERCRVFIWSCTNRLL